MPLSRVTIGALEDIYGWGLASQSGSWGLRFGRPAAGGVHAKASRGARATQNRRARAPSPNPQARQRGLLKSRRLGLHPTHHERGRLQGRRVARQQPWGGCRTRGDAPGAHPPGRRPPGPLTAGLAVAGFTGLSRPWITCFGLVHRPFAAWMGITETRVCLALPCSRLQSRAHTPTAFVLTALSLARFIETCAELLATDHKHPSEPRQATA